MLHRRFETIVLDLDKTLIHTPQGNSEFVHPDTAAALTRVLIFNNSQTTFKRPHLDKFFKFIFTHFRVIVWTAADDKYAKEVIKAIGMPKPYAIFSSKTSEECEKQTGHHKLLQFIIKDTGPKPLIIDDRQDVYDSQKENAFHISEFVTMKPDAYNDTALLYLINYLKTECNIKKKKKKKSCIVDLKQLFLTLTKR